MSAANGFISLGLKDAGYEYGAIDHILDKIWPSSNKYAMQSISMTAGLRWHGLTAKWSLIQKNSRAA